MPTDTTTELRFPVPNVPLTSGMRQEAATRYSDGTPFGADGDIGHHLRAAAQVLSEAADAWRDKSAYASEIAIRCGTAEYHLARAGELLAVHWGD